MACVACDNFVPGSIPLASIRTVLPITLRPWVTGLRTVWDVCVMPLALIKNLPSSPAGCINSKPCSIASLYTGVTYSPSRGLSICFTAPDPNILPSLESATFLSSAVFSRVSFVEAMPFDLRWLAISFKYFCWAVIWDRLLNVLT